MAGMLSTLQLRLLAMILVILAPLAAFISIGARTTYDTALRALQTSESSVVTNVGAQLRIGLAASRRVLTTLAAAADLSDGTPESCNRIFARSIAASPGSVAVRVKRGDGMVCSAVKDSHATDAQAIFALFDQVGKGAPPKETMPGYTGTAWFDSGRAGTSNYFVVKIEDKTPNGAIVGELAVDPVRFGLIMDEFRTARDSTVAVFGKDDAPLLLQGMEEANTNWLPASALREMPEEQPVDLTARDGEHRTYIRSSVAGANIPFLVGFKSDTERAIQQQFLAFLIAPLATLLILWLAYTRMIRLHVLRWTNGLAEAARLSAANHAARAPESEAMPSELRDVGKSFNLMLDRQADRERSLEEALARNQHLSRELHHRVKNSLQIVQSYLGLAKRSESGAARRALLITECRVNALSTAYRLALADGELKDAPIDDYLESVSANVAALLRNHTQTVRSHFELHMRSQIDLVTPLGLIIVEVLVELLGAHEKLTITIEGARDEQGERQLTFSTDIAVAKRPAGKLLLGLIQQAEAALAQAPEPQIFLRIALPRDPA